MSLDGVYSPTVWCGRHSRKASTQEAQGSEASLRSTLRPYVKGKKGWVTVDRWMYGQIDDRNITATMGDSCVEGSIKGLCQLETRTPFEH